MNILIGLLKRGISLSGYLREEYLYQDTRERNIFIEIVDSGISLWDT